MVAAASRHHITPEGIRGLADGTLPIPDEVSDDLVIVNFKEWPIVGPYHGREGLRRWARDTFDPIDDGYFEPRAYPIEVGAGVLVAQFTARGSLKETGMELEYPMCAVQAVRGGKLVRSHGFLDLDEALAEARAWAAANAA